MNKVLNNYLYESYKIFKYLNLVEDNQELEINEMDNKILKSFYKELKMFKDVEYETFLEIIKKMSIEYNKIPIDICYILYKLQKK